MSKKQLDHYLEDLEKFSGASLTRKISEIEFAGKGITKDGIDRFLSKQSVSSEILHSAAQIKSLSAQIDVTIHALGILKCLPHILTENETVLSMSLGAGNTGRGFDLETNKRICEFKFINWKGGSESIRQNGVFKDFLLLAIEPTQKKKELYLLGTQHAEKFLRGNRSMESILSKNEKIRSTFYDHFSDKYEKVGEFYSDFKDSVDLVDASVFVPELLQQSIKTLHKQQNQDNEELAIRNVINLYGLAADCGDIETALACHCEDAVYVVSSPRAGRDGEAEDLYLTGHDAIRAMLSSDMHQSLLPNCAHTVGPLVVKVDGGDAKVLGYSRVYNQVNGAPKLMRLAFNRWDMRKEDSGWKIARRESRVIGEDKAQDLLKGAVGEML